jgi:DNA polymerase
MNLITVDIETFYSKDYSLSKITTEAYVNDIRFEAIGIAVKRNNEPTRWFTGSYSEIKGWLSQFDWGNSMVIAHNAMFDGAILGWRFGIYPKAVVCTLSMARALHAVSVGGSLAALAEYYRLGVKGTEVLNAIGKRRLDFSKTEMDAYGSYCINDVELTYKLFKAMLPKIHMRELKLVDMTIRMYTDPMLKLDTDMLYAHLADVREQKEKLLEECGINKDDLMSNQKFASVLEMFGVEPPTKINSKGLETYAFAKTDEGFKALAEHDDPRVQAIVAARLGTKSTLEETRTERFIAISERPYRESLLPVPLLYYGARTGRWSACVVADTRLTVYDAVDGVVEKRIVDVLLDDLIWDGEAFVQHEGVVFNGFAEVITWDGITGTEDHVVFTEDGERSLHSAMQAECRIKVAGAVTQDAVDAARKLSSTNKS